MNNPKEVARDVLQWIFDQLMENKGFNDTFHEVLAEGLARGKPSKKSLQKLDQVAALATREILGE